VSRAASGYVVAGESWLHRRHPLTKLLGVVFVLVAAFLLPPIALVPLAVGLVAIAVSAGLARPLVRSFRIPAVLIASILVVNALFYPGGSDVLLGVGPLAITGEGMTFGIVAAGRLIVVFVALLLLLFTTLPDDLLEGLVARGVGHRIAFVVLSAVQAVPRMQDRAARILEAQAARGSAINGSMGARWRALIPRIGPVVLGALVDVRERTFALEARGFGARPGRTAYRVVADSGLDRVLRAMALVATVLVILLTVTGAVR
jgi:energy-coupling factor transport system permease protein